MTHLRFFAVTTALLLTLAPLGCGDDTDDTDLVVDAGEDATIGEDGGPEPDGGGSVDDDGGVAGTECGDEVCATGEQCCVTETDASCIDEEDLCEGWAGTCTPGEGDCEEGQECCILVSGSECVAEDSCDPVAGECTTTEDCGDEEVCCADGPDVSCTDEACDGFVRCTDDEECMEAGAGNCCRQGVCAPVCGPEA